MKLQNKRSKNFFLYWSIPKEGLDGRLTSRIRMLKIFQKFLSTNSIYGTKIYAATFETHYVHIMFMCPKVETWQTLTLYTRLFLENIRWPSREGPTPSHVELAPGATVLHRSFWQINADISITPDTVVPSQAPGTRLTNDSWISSHFCQPTPYLVIFQDVWSI